MVYLRCHDITRVLKNFPCVSFQARAPSSEVLIVGTHLDLLPKKNRQDRVDALKQSIARKYLDNQGFPKIVGNIVVSPTTGENIPELKELIYSKALKVKDHGENIIGRMVISFYCFPFLFAHPLWLRMFPQIIS